MKRNIASLSTGLALLFASKASLSAAVSTWSGAADTFWTTPGNWAPGVPVSGDDIVFPNVANQTVDLNATAPSVATLTFNSPHAYSTKAKEAMFFYTDTADSPWTVIKSDDKKRARLNAMRYILHRLPYTNKDVSRIGSLDLLLVGRAHVVYESGEHQANPLL